MWTLTETMTAFRPSSQMAQSRRIRPRIRRDQNQVKAAEAARVSVAVAR